MNNPFTGLIGFPLTPLQKQRIDFEAFERLLERQYISSVDSVCVLGSTGCYPYFSLQSRKKILQVARNLISNRPLFCAIGGISLVEVMRSLEDAQSVGVDGVLLSPVSYQPLTEDEVFSLYEAVSKELSKPLCVYFNSTTTKFEFSDSLIGEISFLKNVSSIKMLGIKNGDLLTQNNIESLKGKLKEGVTLGVSGDHVAVNGLKVGFNAWHSVLAGLYPEHALNLYNTARSAPTSTQNFDFEPLWILFKKYGSLRVIATMAEIDLVVNEDCLPLPLQSLKGFAREQVYSVMQQLQFYK